MEHPDIAIKGKVALRHCPFGHRLFSENFKVMDEEFCLAPPIILAYANAKK